MNEGMMEELIALDKYEQALLQEGDRQGRPFEEVYQEVRELIRPTFYEILRRYDAAAVFAIKYPFAHNGETESNP